MQVRSLASLSGLRIRHSHELWCRSQMQLTSGISASLAQAGSCNSDLTPSLGTSTCHGCSPKKHKEREREREREREKLSFFERGKEEVRISEDRNMKVQRKEIEGLKNQMASIFSTEQVICLELGLGAKGQFGNLRMETVQGSCCKECSAKLKGDDRKDCPVAIQLMLECMNL